MPQRTASDCWRSPGCARKDQRHPVVVQGADRSFPFLERNAVDHRGKSPDGQTLAASQATIPTNQTEDDQHESLG